MPLTKGAKPGSAGFNRNVKEMYEAGHPLDQSLAASYSAARQKKGKKKK